jgi:hypothetical protein
MTEPFEAWNKKPTPQENKYQDFFDFKNFPDKNES